MASRTTTTHRATPLINGNGAISPAAAVNFAILRHESIPDMVVEQENEQTSTAAHMHAFILCCYQYHRDNQYTIHDRSCCKSSSEPYASLHVNIAEMVYAAIIRTLLQARRCRLPGFLDKHAASHGFISSTPESPALQSYTNPWRHHAILGPDLFEFHR